MAALNALSMVFNIAPIQIGAGQIDGIQKFLDGLPYQKNIFLLFCNTTIGIQALQLK